MTGKHEADIPEEGAFNVFDKQDTYTDIPVTVPLYGEKVTVGTATVTNTEDMVHIEIDVKNDAPEEVVEFLKGGITGYSIDNAGKLDEVNLDTMSPDHEINYEEAQAVFEFPDHEHKPVQHRDGKPPWCDVCGLTTGYLKPPSPNWFGKPANPVYKKERTDD